MATPTIYDKRVEEALNKAQVALDSAHRALEKINESDFSKSRYAEFSSLFKQAKGSAYQGLLYVDRIKKYSR